MGHEIALHGYKHERWDTLDIKEARHRLWLASKIYYKAIKKEPRGFRAPQFSATFGLLHLLEDMKFTYDSSTVQFPLTQAVFFPSRIWLYIKQHFFWMNMGIKRWPVSTFGLPMSMFTLKRFPSLFSLACMLKRRLVYLTHSYELDEKGLEKLEGFIQKYRSEKFIKLEDL